MKTDVHQTLEWGRMKMTLRILLRIFAVLLICFVCFAIGLSMSNEEEAGKHVNCSVHYLDANMAQRLMCLNVTEKEICSECVYSGLVSLHRLMIEGI
jgi:hypothetical protein